MLIAPSVLDVKDDLLEEQVRALSKNGADWIHIDVIDWNRTPVKRDYQLEPLRYAKCKPYNVHLMVDDAYKYIRAYSTIADHITIQGTMRAQGDIEKQLECIRNHRIKGGIALNPDEPFADIEPVIDKLHHLLFMTVFSGYGGQKFMPNVLEKVAAAHKFRAERNLRFLIGIDGGVNDQTVELVRPFADYVVAGSYVMKASDKRNAINSLRNTPKENMS